MQTRRSVLKLAASGLAASPLLGSSCLSVVVDATQQKKLERRTGLEQALPWSPRAVTPWQYGANRVSQPKRAMRLVQSMCARLPVRGAVPPAAGSKVETRGCSGRVAWASGGS